MNQRAYYRLVGALGMCIGLWAAAFVGIRAAVASYPPAHLASLRFLVTSIALALYALLNPIKLPENKDIPYFLALGLIGAAVYHLSLCRGEQTVTAGSAGLLINTVPIFVAILSSLFFQESLKAREWIGIFIGFTGIAIISMGESGGLHMESGVWFVILAAVCSSIYLTFQRGLLRKYGPTTFACCANWSGTLFLLPFTLGLPQTIRTTPWTATAGVVFLGIFPGAVAAVLWAHILNRIPATKAAAAIYLVPVATIGIAAILLREMPSVQSLAGGAVALAGVALVNMGRLKKLIPFFEEA